MLSTEVQREQCCSEFCDRNRLTGLEKQKDRWNNQN
jgi:hypothetical protein